MPEDISSNIVMDDSGKVVVTADVTEQVREIENKKKKWLSDKADVLLSSDNKKELVIGLIEDFNNVYGACKQIEKMAVSGIKGTTFTQLQDSLLQIVRYFDSEFQI